MLYTQQKLSYVFLELCKVYDTMPTKWRNWGLIAISEVKYVRVILDFKFSLYTTVHKDGRPKTFLLKSIIWKSQNLYVWEFICNEPPYSMILCFSKKIVFIKSITFQPTTLFQEIFTLLWRLSNLDLDYILFRFFVCIEASGQSCYENLLEIPNSQTFKNYCALKILWC